MNRQELWQKYLKGSSASTGASSSRDDVLRSLGRVLVWLMTPVAAEVLKYGKVLVADPQRPRKVLQVLTEVAIMKEKRLSGLGNSASTSDITSETSSNSSVIASASVTKKSGTIDISSVVPITLEDQEAILQWAYYEAELLLKQYGDVLEGLNDYITVGTSNVAECVEFLESELS